MSALYHLDEPCGNGPMIDSALDANSPNPVKNKAIATFAENIAPIETSPATSSHTVGTQLIYNEVLYDVIAAIAVGDTLTVNTNIVVADSVSEKIKDLDSAKAEKSDLTNLKLTGTTNATGSTISSGTYFYLNGTLVRAKADIANGATFTLNTNYEVVTAGVLNEKGFLNWNYLGRKSAGQSLPTQNGAHEYMLVCHTPYWAVYAVVLNPTATTMVGTANVIGFCIEGGKIGAVWQDSQVSASGYVDAYYR